MAGHRRIVQASLGMALCLVIGSCQSEHREVPYFIFDPAFESRLEVSLTELPLPLLWRREKEKLYLRDTFQIKQQLVMVSFQLGSPLADQLQTDLRTILYRPAEFMHSGYALVKLKTERELGELAIAAHHHQGFGCGNLERLNLQSNLITSTTIVAPSYYPGKQLSTVKSLLTHTNSDEIKNRVDDLVALGSRYHASTAGVSAADTVQTLFSNAIASGITGVSYQQKSHSGTSQKSLIVRIPGSDDAATSVIIGAHLDSISRTASGVLAENDAPGADDDASGIATMIEIARSIRIAGAKFKRSIEFHAYAAEEVGFIGSGEIAADYKNTGRSVAGMMQIDMDSYHSDSNSRKIYLVSNETSGNLKRDLKSLLQTYLGGDYEEKTLSGGSSDHKSWTNQGFPAVFPFEDPGNFNRNLHTSNDTTANANNFGLSERFAKLGLAFLAHYAGLTAASGEYDSALSGLSVSAGSNDLKVALIEQGDSTYLAVASPTSIARIETCETSDKGSLSCKDDRITLEFVGERNERKFFRSVDPVAVVDLKKFRLHGFDHDDQLQAVRNMFTEKR